MSAGRWATGALRDLLPAAAQVPDGPPNPPGSDRTAPPPAADQRGRDERAEPDRQLAAYDPAALVHGVRHGDTNARRAVRWLRRIVNAHAEDRALMEAAAATRQPVSTGRRIGVAGARGGSGRTTLAALLAGVYAARRSDPVLVVDADPELGALAFRLGIGEGAGALRQRAPAAGAPRPAGFAELSKILPRTPGGLWVMPAAAVRASTTGDVALTLAETLSRFFGVTVLDRGSDVSGRGAPAAALDRAHSAVLTAAATPDGVRALRSALDSAADTDPNLARRLVVVLVSRTPVGEALDVTAALKTVAGTGAAAYYLPYDRHLAAGARIDPNRIAEATLLTVTRIAGAAVTRATAG